MGGGISKNKCLSQHKKCRVNNLRLKLKMHNHGTHININNRTLMSYVILLLCNNKAGPELITDILKNKHVLNGHVYVFSNLNPQNTTFSSNNRIEPNFFVLRLKITFKNLTILCFDINTSQSCICDFENNVHTIIGIMNNTKYNIRHTYNYLNDIMCTHYEPIVDELYTEETHANICNIKINSYTDVCDFYVNTLYFRYAIFIILNNILQTFPGEEYESMCYILNDTTTELYKYFNKDKPKN